MKTDLQNILESLQSGRIGVEEAMLAIKKAPFVELGYAKVDLHRAVRQGAPEVIYGAGKTAEQIIGIVEQLRCSSHGWTQIKRMQLDAHASWSITVRQTLPCLAAKQNPTDLERWSLPAAARATCPWLRRLR